jgi:hypothetical protein
MLPECYWCKNPELYDIDEKVVIDAPPNRDGETYDIQKDKFWLLDKASYNITRRFYQRSYKMIKCHKERMARRDKFIKSKK